MRTKTKTAVYLSVFAVVAVWLSPTSRTQQSTATPVASLKMQVNEVVLPVTVRDKHGALVTNLQKSDFTLTDDGKPQVIKSFARETNLPYRVGLLVDTSRSMSGAMQAERKAAGQFIDQMLPAEPNQGRDQAFLIHFDREVELLQDFTASREKLHRELDEMGPTHQTPYENQGPETNGDDRQRPRGRNGTQLYDAIYLAADELMKGKDGRKALVVFSDGADHGSKETLNGAVDAADRANLAVYTVYFKGEEEHNENGFSRGGRRGGMGGGWPGGGGGYPGGYPGGGRRGGGTSDNGMDGKKVMQQIATRTGGHAFEAKKKEDLEQIYKLIEEELRSQYLLSFTPDKLDNDGGFHKIVLTANKSDLTVATREGYYAPGGDSSK